MAPICEAQITRSFSDSFRVNECSFLTLLNYFINEFCDIHFQHVYS